MATFKASMQLKQVVQSMTVVALASTLSACGSSSQPPEREVMPVKDTVFAPAVNALDKAKGVQDTLEQSKAQTDAALQNAEK